MVKKQLIMEKALELFAKQGFEATSIQQITEKCGISKGAFYLSFKSKDELILHLIDHFMIQFTSDLDHIVKNMNKDQQLYEFYYTAYHFFYQHLDFAKIFIKEQSYTLNKDLFAKIRYYDKLNEKIILLMIEQIYGEEIVPFKYDLMFCIKNFMGMYAELFMYESIEPDFQLLSKSLVEKTNLLAKHMSIPYITKHYFSILEYGPIENITKEMLLNILEQKIKEMEHSLEKDSLFLLKQELLNPSLHPALVKGLIENIRKHPHCKWMAYLLDKYYEKI